MIVFENTGKAFRNRKGEISWVIRNLDVSFPLGRSVGILASAGEGKSTLINLAAGNEQPSEGRIYRQARISWPYSFRGNISQKLTGKQNVRFLSDVYGRNFKEAYDFVAEFADLGKYLDMPLKNYNNEMRGRLSVSALFAMDFDCILVDDAMDGGDASFRRRCTQYLSDNAERITLFVATSNPQLVNRYCQTGGVLHDGKLSLYDTVEEAIEAFGSVNEAFV